MLATGYESQALLLLLGFIVNCFKLGHLNPQLSEK